MVETQDFASLPPSSSLRVESILHPILHIGEDVHTDAFIFPEIADYMIMIARLPCEGDIDLASEFGHADFITTNDGCQVLQLWAEFILWWR